MRRVIYPLFAAIIATILYSLYNRPAVSDADRIRQVIATVAKAAEEKDAAKIVGLVDDAYSDNRDNSKQTLRAVLVQLFMSYRDIKTTVSHISVEVEGETAEAAFKGTVSGDGATWYGSFVVSFVKRGKHWLIRKVHVEEER